VTDKKGKGENTSEQQEERQSLLSGNSSNSSVYSDILYTNQRLIFKYPDGSYSYAFKCTKDPDSKKGDNQKDNWLHVKS